MFYVALTRACDSLAIVTERWKKSPFLADMGELPRISWKKLPPVPSLDGERYESEIERKLTAASEEEVERRERVAHFWSRKGEGLGGGQ